MLAGSASHIAFVLLQSSSKGLLGGLEAAHALPYPLLLGVLCDAMDLCTNGEGVLLGDHVLVVATFSHFMDTLGDKLKETKVGSLTIGQLRIYIRDWLRSMVAESRRELVPILGASAWVSISSLLADMRAASIVIPTEPLHEESASAERHAEPEAPQSLPEPLPESCVRAVAQAITLGMLAQGGSLALLGVIAPLLARVHPRQRYEGLDGLVATLVCQLVPAFGTTNDAETTLAAMLKRSSPHAVACELMSMLVARMPAPELCTIPVSWFGAQQQIASMLSVAGPVVLRLSNLGGALDWFSSLRTLVGGATAGEAWTLLETLMIKSEVASGELTLGKLRLVHDAIDPLVRHLPSDGLAALGPDGRVARVVALLSDRKAEERAASKHGDSVSSGGSGLVGYPRAFRLAMLKHIDKASTIALYARVESLITSEAHPFEAIGEIFHARDPLLWHALCGVKDTVSEVSAVRMVADHLRDDPPEYLGHAGFELLTVNEIQEHDDGEYPKCAKLWGVFQSGDLGKLDLENDWAREISLFYTGEAAPVVPASALYTDVNLLRVLHKAVNTDDGLWCALAGMASLRCTPSLARPLAFSREPSLCPTPVGSKPCMSTSLGC